jgi:NHL repeat
VKQTRSPVIHAALLMTIATAIALSPWFTDSALAQGQRAVDNSNAPAIPFDVVPNFLKYPATMNLGEVLGVAVNSKGNVVVLNHPGTPKSGPLYGNATTQVLEFDGNGNLLREIGEGVYGFGYSHAVRFDRYDNLWIVDKGTNSVMKFNPEGYVTMNLGRRPEGYELEIHRPTPAEKVPVDGYFDGPTDIGWDADDNIFVSEGYVNNRIAKFDKHGNWIKAWGKYGEGGAQANENPGSFRNAHSMQLDRDGNVYVADRANRRIQVFDKEGRFLKFLFLNVPYDKTRQPVLGNKPATLPDQTSPWALCITNTTPQYLYAVDTEPGRLYKMTLDGRILGYLGESGRQVGQFNWAHGIACPRENEVIVADMNNWRVQKLILHPERPAAGAGR